MEWRSGNSNHLGRTIPPYRTENCPYCRGSGKHWLTSGIDPFDAEGIVYAKALPCSHCVDPILNPLKSR